MQRNSNGTIKLSKNSAFAKLARADASDHPQIVPYLERYLDMVPATESKIEIEDFTRKPRKVKERFNPSSDCERCMRDLYFSMCGDYEIPEEKIDGHLRMVFNIGTATHCLVQAYLKDMGRYPGFPSEYGEGAETRMWAPQFRMSGYIDDVMRFPNWDEPVCLELKTISSKGFDSLKGPKPAHRWQIGCYLMATGYSGGILLYVNKDNQTFKEFWVEQIDMQPVLQRWAMVEQALGSKSPNGLMYECQRGSKKMADCPWHAICRGE